MTGREILVELLPQERDVILRCILTPEVREQLQPLAATRDVETIRLDRVLVHWIAGDLTHAIVKGNQCDEAIIDLAERFDYIDDIGDGRLENWS
jgi:hypothetical protein